MEFAAKLARGADKVLSLIAVLMILLLLCYGGYSLWDTAMLYKGAFNSSDLLQYKPSADDPESLTFEELLKLNPDVCAWITVDDTHIDYPVVQGKDNMEYVNKDVKGEFAFSGAIFLDSQNKRDFSDSYNLLYGHHMEGGAMFGDVVEFRDKSYFDSHETGTLYLPGKAIPITFFACVSTDAFDSVVYHPDAQPAGDVTTLLKYLQGTAVQYREHRSDGERSDYRFVNLFRSGDQWPCCVVRAAGQIRSKHKKEVLKDTMNQKKTRFRKLLLLPLLIAVLLFPTQALAVYSCTVQLPVEVKTITKTEDTEIPTGEVYTVVLTAEDNAPLPEETRLTVTDNGRVEFGPITYTKPGDYVYTVYQDVGETEFYTYDRAIYTVTVRVVNDDEGGLTAEIWAIRDDETEKMENVVFTNVYTPEEEPEPDGSSSASTSAKPLVKKPNTPKTGDSANLTLWTCLLAASALGIITLLAALLKRNQK